MASHEELTCQELVELVTEYLEGTLPKADRARFEEHIAGCQGCRTYLEQMRATIQTIGRIEEAAIPPEATEELLQVFRSWRASPPTKDRQSGA